MSATTGRYEPPQILSSYRTDELVAAACSVTIYKRPV